MSRIAFMGDRDSIWGFEAFGVDVYPTTGPGDAREAFAALPSGRYTIIFVTEDVYEACQDQIAEFRDLPFPTVTVIPNVRESRDVAALEIHRAVAAAVGADILAGGERE